MLLLALVFRRPSLVSRVLPAIAKINCRAICSFVWLAIRSLLATARLRRAKATEEEEQML